MFKPEININDKINMVQEWMRKMEFVNYINEILTPKNTEKYKVLDLFAGCGGLSLGFEAAGYETIGYEMNKSAVETYNKNLQGVCHQAMLEVGFNYPAVDIVIGGPPCQPFSVRGTQKGINDSRDGFPIFIDAVKQIKPRIFLFENVRNLMYSHSWYLDMIVNELEELGYNIEIQCVNAVNYGVPQNRERIIVVGHKSSFSYPTTKKQRITVENAIGDLMYTVPEGSKFLTKSQDEYIAKYEKASCCRVPRDLHPNKPARTITCRNLAGATSDMQRVRLKDGRRRRLICREAARLQSFPDWFEFYGNETEKFNQIGNAVPPLLAYQLAISVKNALDCDSKNIRIISPKYTQKKLLEVV